LAIADHPLFAIFLDFSFAFLFIFCLSIHPTPPPSLQPGGGQPSNNNARGMSASGMDYARVVNAMVEGAGDAESWAQEMAAAGGGGEIGECWEALGAMVADRSR
jgi:hypothetical protein